MGVWCSKRLWRRIKGLLESRMEQVQHLELHQAQQQAAHQQALERSTIDSRVREQRSYEQRRALELEVRHYEILSISDRTF
jgi:hypothetical protein